MHSFCYILETNHISERRFLCPFTLTFTIEGQRIGVAGFTGSLSHLQDYDLLQLPSTVGTGAVHQPGASEGAERGTSPLVLGFGPQLEGHWKAEKVVACPKWHIFNNH